LIQNGDVHLLSQFLGVNEFTIETPTMLEIRQALSGTGNRTFYLLDQKNDRLES
jgi:hypothetical protein